jgi:hypothetical protein
VIATLLFAVGFITLGVAMGADWHQIGFEIAKAGAQLAILSVIGGAFAAALKYLESTREERRRLNGYRLSVLRSLTISYNRIKAVRRTLRAFGFDAGNPRPLTVEQVTEFHVQMKSLNEAQLAVGTSETGGQCMVRCLSRIQEIHRSTGTRRGLCGRHHQ